MKPKPLVALNHFTVPMLTGVVPSQDRYSRSPLSDGLVRSNFWKGRQRLNRLYRWIANVVRPKIDVIILFQSSPQNNPEVHDFLIAPRTAARGNRLCTHMNLSCTIRRQLPAPTTCGGIGRVAAPPVGLRRRPDARPCDGRLAVFFPDHRVTSRSSPDRPPAS